MPAPANLAARPAAPAPRAAPDAKAAPRPALVAKPARTTAPALPAFARPASVPASRPGLAPLATASASGSGAGQPLAPHVREAIQNSLHVDLSPVRLHSGPDAERKAQSFSARAFTFGHDIFLGSGERTTDLSLIAHEATHVVQQRGEPTLHAWSDDRGDRFEREADRASAAITRGEPFAVREHVSSPRVQRLGIGAALDYLAKAAYNIPGFRMFTLVLGVNPVNMQPVDRSAANVLRAVIEFMIGGALIVQALDNYGLIDKVGAWLQTQLNTLGIIGASIKTALLDFLHSLKWTDIFHVEDVFERAKHIFTDPINRIKSFVTGLVKDIWDFVRKAILMPLAKLAEGTAGWPLLTAVLGKNPITGEPVPRTPETLIGGFLKLIHQDELWANIQKAHALPRAWAWFQGALAGLMGFVAQIPHLFEQALHTLEWSDVILLPRAFAKIAGVFGGFLGRFISWAGNTVWNLLEIIFEAVAPSVMPYLRRVGAAFRKILHDPIGFVMHLVAAAKLGFENFGSNILQHLKAALLDWLTGSLPGVYIPKAFTLGEFGHFALSVLGITWAQIRGKIVKALGPNGERIMTVLETAFDIVVALVTGGPAAAWELIKEKLTNLQDMIVDGIIGFVTDTIVKKAIPKLIAMFIPGAGFISAIISIYGTIKVFIEKLAKIAAVVKAFVDSIVSIANGQIEGAALKVESTLEGLLSLVISFLAGFLGLGDITSKIRDVIAKVRGAVDKALDTGINWIVNKAKALFAKLFGKEEKPDQRTEEQKKADLQAALSDAEQLSKKPGITEGEVKAGLPAIKSKYKMVSLNLVVEKVEESGNEEIHFEGEINPTAVSGKATLTSDKNKKITDLDLPRASSFSAGTARELAKGLPAGETLTTMGWDRRHVVSSENMIDHYRSNLVGATWAQAKQRLDPTLGKNGLGDVDPLTDKQILAKTKNLYKEFYNDNENLFLGPLGVNRSIGEKLDKDKFKNNQKALDDHLAYIEQQYAIGGPSALKIWK